MEYMNEYGKEITTRLIPAGSVPGKLYGLIKVHKQDNPAKLVVSMIKTPEYKLAKFLDSIIKPHVLNSYIVQSTDDFLTKLKDFDFNSNQFLVSYDVKSLFTNIPLSYTFIIIADYMYSPYYNEHPPIEKNIFIKLMYLSTRGMFLYNNKLYQLLQSLFIFFSTSFEPAFLFVLRLSYCFFQSNSHICFKLRAFCKLHKQTSFLLNVFNDFCSD